MLGKFYSLIITKQLIAPIMAVLLITGCASRRFIDMTDDASNNQKQSLSYYESTLNPSDYDREVSGIEKMQKEEKQGLNPLDIPKDTLVMQEEIVQGFRVQVFSSSGVDEANLMKNIVQEKFINDSVYVVYDPPVYKVRAGDFLNRYEANQRLQDFVAGGYRDAWIVPDRIIQRKIVRISVPK
jgi:hypothetical protein